MFSSTKLSHGVIGKKPPKCIFANTSGAFEGGTVEVYWLNFHLKWPHVTSSETFPEFTFGGTWEF